MVVFSQEVVLKVNIALSKSQMLPNLLPLPLNHSWTPGFVFPLRTLATPGFSATLASYLVRLRASLFRHHSSKHAGHDLLWNLNPSMQVESKEHAELWGLL